MAASFLRLGRARIAFLHDVIMAALSLPLALQLRLGDALLDQSRDLLAIGVPIFTLVAAVVFWLTGLYRGIWRYASMRDLLAIARAATLAILIFLPIMFLISRLDGLPRSALLINWFVLMTLLGAPRFIYRVVRDGGIVHLLERDEPLRTPVLLVGAGDAAELFIREMARSRAAPFRVVGILDAGDSRVGRQIHGVPVLGAVDAAERIVIGLSQGGRRPQRLVITQELMQPDRLRALLEIADAHGMTLARLPRLTELQQGSGGAPGEIRPIALEDLLGRPQTVLDKAAMRRLVAGRRVLVTGAGGSIGGELVRQIACFAPAHLTLLDHAEHLLYQIETEIRRQWPGLSCAAALADIRQRLRLNQLLVEQRPDLVFHAAALKHVPIAEANPAETVLTNVVGTRNMADACRTAGVAAMVLISTDKAVNPAGVLGATKRLAETYCQTLEAESRSLTAVASGGPTRLVIVRFGNVLGSTGSVVPLFQQQLAQGGPLTVTHPDMTRYFMTVREAVELVLQATAFGLDHPEPSGGSVFVLDMGRPVRVVDLARQIIRLSGKRPGVDIAIRFTGPRPGEKLYEELFQADETPAPTAVPGVLRAVLREIDGRALGTGLDELAAAAADGRIEQVQALLRRLVPEYAPPSAPAAAAS